VRAVSGQGEGDVQGELDVQRLWQGLGASAVRGRVSGHASRRRCSRGDLGASLGQGEGGDLGEGEGEGESEGGDLGEGPETKIPARGGVWLGSVPTKRREV
jgi:hypothetical protein